MDDVPHSLRVSELGEVAGAAGHHIVDEQGFVIDAIRFCGGVDNLGNLNVVGGAAELLTQPQQKCRSQAGPGELVTESHGGGQADEGTLRLEGVRERNLSGVLLV